MSDSMKKGGLGRRQVLQLAGGALAGAISSPVLAGLDVKNAMPLIDGKAVTRGTPYYEAWRQSMTWNYRHFNRYPDMIVQAENEADVVKTIKYARQHGKRITTRSGGHSWCGCFLRDGGMLLDLSRLQAIKIDVKNKLAVVEPGVIGRILNARLAEHGLAFPTAHCGMVPISGFLLGGGLGINGGAWGGASTLNIRGIDLVTAEGEKLHATTEQNADYFWAARGAGPGLFFTVTRFYLQCYDLPKAITTAMYILPYSELIALSAALDELGPNIDKRIEMLGVVIPTPPPLKSDSYRDRHVALLSATAFVDSVAEAKRVLEPIARHKVMKTALDVVPDRASNMEMLYQDNEGPFPQARARVDNIFTNKVVAATEVLSRHMPQAPSDGNTPVILWRGDLEFPNSAYSSEGRFYFAGYAQWAEAADDYANQEWLRHLFDDLQVYAASHYINEFDRETRPLQTHACFSRENWEKLQKLRRRYDSDGVFQNFLGLPV